MEEMQQILYSGSDPLPAEPMAGDESLGEELEQARRDASLRLENGVLGHRNDALFAGDPLHALLAAQLAARLCVPVAEKTLALCREMDLSLLTKQEVEQQMRSALLLSARPSGFFRALRQMEQLELWFPELNAMIGVEQSPIYHAEGDVWNHTMMVVDEAACFRPLTPAPYALMLGALCHDMGKPSCTTVIDGKIHAYEHEIKGMAPARNFLRRMKLDRNMIAQVRSLVRHHMRPNALAEQQSSVKATNRLFDEAEDPLTLIYLSIADARGIRSPLPFVSHEAFLMERLEVYQHLLEQPCPDRTALLEAGLPEDADLSGYLDYARRLHLSEMPYKSVLSQTLSMAHRDGLLPGWKPKRGKKGKKKKAPGQSTAVLPSEC